MQVGTIVDEQYEIIDTIGDGGMGRVYKAREIGLERVIALKCLHAGLLSDVESRLRFEREGKVLAAVRHPNILLFYRFGIWQGQFPYIAMELINGRNIRQRITDSGPLDSKLTVIIGRQICAALAEAHKRNIVHRDLKPGNIMLASGEDESRCVRVLDFGLARVLEPEDARVKQSLTQTGELVGSVFYMSPEQCRGQRADHRSDIYSLGCLLYECITGDPPFSADNPVGLMHLHLYAQPADLVKAVTLKGLNNVILKAMQKDPAARYQAMDEMKADLDLVLQGDGQNIASIAPTKPRTQTKSKLIVPAVTAALIVAAGVTFSIANIKSNSDIGPESPHLYKTIMPRTSTGTLGPILPEYKQIQAQFPATTERIAALKQWISRYGNRNPLDTAHGYHHLGNDLRANSATAEEVAETLKNALDRYERILAASVPNNKEQILPPELQEAAFHACEILNNNHQSERSTEILLRLLKNWKHSDSKRLWTLYEGLARAAGLRKDYKQQEHWYKEYMKKATYAKTDAAVQYACFLLERKRNTDSEKVIDEAISESQQSDSQSFSSLLKFAKVLSYQHRYKLARKYAEAARAGSPMLDAKGEISGVEAACLIGDGNYREAQPLLQEAWKSATGLEKWNILLEVVQNAQRAKVPLDAQGLLDKQILSAGGAPDALNGLRALLDRTVSADIDFQILIINTYKKIHSSIPQQQLPRYAIHYTAFANSALSKGRIGEAESMHKDILAHLDLVPKNIREQIRLQCIISLASGAWHSHSPNAPAMAEAAYNDIIHSEATDTIKVQAVALKALLLHSQKRCEEGRALLEQALQRADHLEPLEKISLYRTYADSCKQLGRIDEYKKWSERADQIY